MILRLIFLLVLALKCSALYANNQNLNYNSDLAQKQFNTGYEYYVNKEYPQAKKWLEKSANSGNSNAQAYLGTMYLSGHGVEVNLEKAFYWIEISAKSDNPLAQASLGHMYTTGKGVSKNENRAFYWYEKSATQGYHLAMAATAELYLNGSGVKRDLILAYAWTIAGDFPSYYQRNVQKKIESVISPDQKKYAISIASRWSPGKKMSL